MISAEKKYFSHFGRKKIWEMTIMQKKPKVLLKHTT
jgi:hypothetical protein